MYTLYGCSRRSAKIWLQIWLSDAVDKFSKLEDINKFLVCGTFCKERRATSDPGYIDKPETWTNNCGKKQQKTVRSKLDL